MSTTRNKSPLATHIWVFWGYQTKKYCATHPSEVLCVSHLQPQLEYTQLGDLKSISINKPIKARIQRLIDSTRPPQRGTC